MRNKYFKSIALMSVAFVAGAIFVTYQGYKEAIHVTKTHFGDHHLLMAGQAGVGIEQNIHALTKLLSILVAEQAIKDMDVDKSRSLLEKMYQHARVHSANDVALMDAAGIIRLALNAPQLEGKDFSFREYYRKAKALKTSAPVYDLVEFKGADIGQKGIIIAMPVFSDEKRFCGVVLFTIKVDELLGGILSWQTGRDKTWVIDSEGNILYHPDYPPGTKVAELTNGSKSFRAFVADVMANGHNLSEYVTPEGVATVAIHYPVSVAGQRWEIVVSALSEEVTGMVARSTQKYGIGILLLVAASTSIALMLKAYNTALEKAHDELEARVKERTTDLSVAEGELRSIYNSISGHLTVISPDYRILSYNETVEKQFGGGLQGKLCYEAYQARNAVCPDCAVKQTLETKKPAYTYQPATSLSKPVEIYTYPIFDDKGEVSAVVEHGVEVGERIELEENFNRQRVLLNTVFETTPDIMYMKDKKGKYLIVNKAFEEFIGVDCDEVVGKTMEDMLPGEFAAESRASDLRVLEGETYHKEQRAEMDGQESIFDTIKMPLRDKDGAVYGIVGISRDITGLKRAEEAIREGKQFLENILDSIQDGICITSKDFTVLMVNRTAETWYEGQLPIVGKKCHEVFRQRPTVCDRCPAIRVFETGESASDIVPFYKPDGTLGSGELYIFPVRNPDTDEITGCIEYFRDVTERKRAEESLRLLLKAVESLTVGVTISDADGKIIYTNPAEAEMHGYDVDELVGKNVNSLAPPELWKTIEMEERGSAFSRESLNLRKDGSVFPVHLTSVRVEDEDSAPFAIITVCEDITERKKAEQALRTAKVLAEEERAKTEAIIACIGDGISIHDRDFMILYQNEAQVGMIGRHVGQYCYKAYEGKDYICEGCPLAKAFEDGGIHMAERSVATDGGLLHVSITASPLRDAEGNIIAGIEVVRDITERKRAEEELAYNQLFLKSIIENEPECVKLLDSDGTLIDMNASGLKMIDADNLEQIKGKNLYDLVAPEHREAFKAHVERVCRGEGEKGMLEFRAVGLKGRSIWLETHAVRFRDAREKRTLLLAVTRDITERKKVETALRERERQLSESQRIAHIGSWQHNLTTNEVVWSDELFRVLGLDPERDMADFDMFFSMISPDDQPMLKKAIEETLETGKHFSVGYRFRMKDGRTRILHAQAELLTDETGTQSILSGTAQDITELKKTEDEIREINTRLQTLVDSIPGMVFFKDAAGRHLVVNRACVEMSGLKEEEIVGKTADEVLPPEVAEHCNESDEEVIQARTTIRVEEDTGGKVLETIKTPLFDESGNYTGMVGLGFDVTERKRAADALKESEKKYRSLFDSARDAIFIADAESGVIVNANRQAEKLLGRPASEIIGMHQSELHPEEERQLYESAFREAVREERPVPATPGSEIFVVGKKGRKIPVEISVNAIEIEGRRLLQGIFRDITGRRTTEKAAREGRQYLENVLNSIQDGICILDMNNTVVKANPTMEKWYAHCAPLVGKKCYEVFMGSTDTCNHCPCEKAIRKGESCTENISYLGPEGPSGTMELHTFPLFDPETGEAKGVIKYFRDITDKVALQAEAFRAAQLASVGELAAGVAHEINNPINGIINYAQLLANRLPAGSEENSISRRIIKEGDRISGIVSALLTFTRDEALVEEPVDLEDLVLESLSLTIAQLAKDGIDVKVDIPEDMPNVNINRQHLEQVFLNLINNSRHALNLKYPERHPEKTLEISGESMTAEDIPHVRISFTDWGTGIAADIIGRVMDPFFTTKQKGSGTGLGLSISSSIIKNSGGTLSVDSVEGEYTRVTIELPVGEV